MIVLSAVVGISSCKKEKVVEPEPDLPPLTTTGRMTFGCYVNGEPWVAEVPPFQPYHNTTGGGLNYDSLMVIFGNKISTANDDHNSAIYLLFSLNKDSVPINIPLSLRETDQTFINYKDTCNSKHQLDISYPNKVEIVHFDLEKRIISGIFNMRAYGVNCNDTVLITDGRFDVKFTIVE